MDAGIVPVRFWFTAIVSSLSLLSFPIDDEIVPDMSVNLRVSFVTLPFA